LHELEARNTTRNAMRAFEEALPSQQRKQLGQYFTGLPLGKLLAHLALRLDTRSVLDPMAGHGDLLDATWEAATERGISLERLDGIEIDETTATTCRNRLAEIVNGSMPPGMRIIAADTFDPASVKPLSLPGYDLVITNPPYVRYQAHNANGTRVGKIRSGVAATIDTRLSGAENNVWKELTESYSGLADLSVPAWLLAAAMVRPGGRLALVVPATWRSRDYADVIRYLLLRCFWLECIVEDEQPGWFSDALVRTHLIVARRLSEEDIAMPMGARTKFPEAIWLQVAPKAAAPGSLVGATFTGPDPEFQFAAWVHNGCKQSKCGISVRQFNLHDEWTALEARVRRRHWYQKLEGRDNDLPLFARPRAAARITVPDILKRMFPDGCSSDALVTLEEAGVHVGQGLRTGCNRFFYVTALGASGAGMARVETSSFFGHQEFSAPEDALRPVLRRQSEMKSIEESRVPEGRVLDLRGWVLPEDYPTVVEAAPAYAACGEPLPRIMPQELADYVRGAAAAPSEGPEGDKRIPDLSAVRTNVRVPLNSHVTPRFWYMLPHFAPRHLGFVFVARINHALPWTEANFESPVLIDANFSTFWGAPKGLTRYALKALLNSVWCRAFMETLGTTLGGGALKLEATHLRQLAVPILSSEAKLNLDAAGKQLTRSTTEVQSRIDAIVLGAVLPQTSSPASRLQLAQALAEHAHNMSCARQRAA
jgi:hypothetical protein